MLARWLDLPLPSYLQSVFQLENSPEFNAIAPMVTLRLLAPAAEMTPDHLAGKLGEVSWCDEGLIFRYANSAIVRIYGWDETALAPQINAPRDPELVRTIAKMRLINSRNALTCSVMECLLKQQEAYLRTGDPHRRMPLTQADLSRLLALPGGSPVIADPSRLSRLLRHLSIVRCGETIPLQYLCPRLNELRRDFVAQIIAKESAWLVDKTVVAPLSDAAIARLSVERFGVSISARAIAYLRTELGIPDRREREMKAGYIAATARFSHLHPLNRETLLHNAVPPDPGVYEIRLASASVHPCSVVYIGGSSNLRKRLQDHVRGAGGNAQLHEHIRSAQTRFRFRTQPDWRTLERSVYQAFCATFGTPPACNRVSP